MKHHTDLVFTVNSMEEVVGVFMMVGIQIVILSGLGQSPVSKRYRAQLSKKGAVRKTTTSLQGNG